MPALPASPEVLAILSRFVEERAGLHYAAESLPLFAEKVAAHALDAGFDTLLDYYYFLRYETDNQTHVDALVDALLVHETYFFREAAPLRALVDALLAPAVGARGRARVWCAACATGEEPLTLAMMLAEAKILPQVEIVASDISARVLDRARRGEFSFRAMRALPPNAHQWIESRAERAVVRDEIRAAVAWRQVNLIDAEAVRQMGTFDAILCRNVLIYFNDDVVRRVVTSLTDALCPGGHLLVGTSESLLRFGTLLSCEEHAGAFFYKRGP